MKFKRIVTITMTALTTMGAGAQTIDDKLASTQHIVFVDSVVVNKTDFLDAYLVNPEAGSLQTYGQFFDSDAEPYSVVYLNQLRNKCFYSRKGRLYTSDLIGGQWNKATQLEGLGRFQRLNYPFMMSDGTTFYFAAISSEGMGGLDIYVSRYDSDKGTFLKAENIGMPFNSAANDYMYVINESDSIGYFATDRHQPSGKVCIYTFIPNSTRQVYSTDEYDEDVIRSRAAIHRIADTWGSGKARKQALARIERLRNGNKPKAKSIDAEFRFVVDDNHVYTSMDDLRNADNRERMKQLLDYQQQLAKLEAQLDKTRRLYTQVPDDERQILTTEILDYEREQRLLQNEIRQLEHAIRQTEQTSY
jgi:hypothetical protein